MPRISRSIFRAINLLLPVLMLAALLSALVPLFHSASGQRPFNAIADGQLSSLSEQAETEAAPNAETASSTPLSGESREARADEAYGHLPLSFEANHGQSDVAVKFLARGPGYGLFLTSTEATLVLRNADFGLRNEKETRDLSNPQSEISNPQSAVVRMQLLGANSAPRVEGEHELAGKSNYFVGNDPQKWRTGVTNYGRAHYRDVYPGVDLVYYGNQRELEYDFVVAPSASPQAIALGFRGVEHLRVDGEGDLLIATTAGEIRQHRPVVYQEVDGERREIAASYVLKGKNEVGFHVAEYDPTRPLVIDPVLTYSTYLGGTGSDSAYSIAVDSRGYAYVTGTTVSEDFPVARPAQAKRAVYPGTTRALYSDAFVSKLNATGTALVYSTYLGGGRTGEIGKGIAVDAAGNAYVTGSTVCSPCVNGRGPSDFPVLNAAQSTAGDPQDAFVTKLSPAGALLFSTFLGGTSTDSAEKVVVDAASGDAYVAGNTAAPGFPTTPGAYKQSSCSTCVNGTNHAFVTKYDASGAVQWSTLIGVGYAYDIALDQAGNTYLTGTAGVGFPVTPEAFQQKPGGGVEAFVAKLNPQGSDLIYSTFLGGVQSDRGYGIAVDASGAAYVTGQTQSAAFPVTTGAFDASYNGGEDAFVAKLNQTGTALVYSTFLGGSAQDVGRGIALDSSNNAYLVGQTKSANFPVKNSLQQKIGTGEIFLTKLNAAGSALIYSSFLGTGEGRDVAVTGTGIAYLTGQAAWIPTTLNAFQTARNAGHNFAEYDAFVMKVSPANEAALIYSISGHITDTFTDNYSVPSTVTLTGKQNRTTHLNAGNNYSFGALPPGTYTVTVSKNGFTFDPPSQTLTIVNTNQTADFTVVENSNPVVTLTSPADNATFTTPANITVTATASDSDGSVAKVEFYANTTSGSVLIGTDTTPPYSATWSNAPTGNHVLTALVTDNLGATAQSQNILSVTVRSSVPPTVALTSPADGSTFRARDNIEVSANVAAGAGASISYVDFYAGTTMIARKTESPYSFIWSPTEAGTFSLTAKAVDDGGAMTTSSPVTVTINPALSTLQGQITDGTSAMSGVLVRLTGARTASVVTGDDGRYSFGNLPAEGGYTVTPSKDGYTFEPASFSTDFLGYYDRTENFRAVRNTPVTVQVTSPSWFAQYTAPATVTINAAASSTAGAITQVDFAYRTASGASFHIGTDTTAPYSFDWTNVPAGDYYVYAIATDSTGETNTSDATPITVNPAPSIVRINGQVTDGGGSGMSGLRVTLSGTRTATAVTNSMGYYVFGNLPAGGSYTVTAPANYTFTPPSYTFNNLTADELSVDFNTTSFNTAPSVALTSPTDGLIVNAPADITLSATASDSDGTVTRVSFYNGATLIGSDTSAPYSFVWGVTTPGTYTITAAAWDNGGLRTISSAVTITVKASSAQTGSPVIEGGGFASLLNASGQTWTPLEAGNHLAPSILTTSVTDGAQALALPIEWSEQSFDGLALEGDYDGDGQIDLAVYRPSDGRWYLLKSSS